MSSTASKIVTILLSWSHTDTPLSRASDLLYDASDFFSQILSVGDARVDDITQSAFRSPAKPTALVKMAMIVSEHASKREIQNGERNMRNIVVSLTENEARSAQSGFVDRFSDWCEWSRGTQTVNAVNSAVQALGTNLADVEVRFVDGKTLDRLRGIPGAPLMCILPHETYSAFLLQPFMPLSASGVSGTWTVPKVDTSESWDDKGEQ